MVLSACFALLVGCVCHRLWEPVGTIITWAPQKSLGPSHLWDPFNCFFCICSCCGAFETQPIKKPSITLGSPQASSCCELELIICWTAQKEMENADAWGALELRRCWAVSCHFSPVEIYWQDCAFSLSYLGTIWFIFKENCRPLLGISKLWGVHKGPSSSLVLSSGTLSLKDVVWKGNLSLVSEQYKFYVQININSSVQKQRPFFLLFLSFFCPITRGITVSFGLESLAHFISNSDEECWFACSTSSCLACNLIYMFCTLLCQCIHSTGSTWDFCTCSIFPH